MNLEKGNKKLINAWAFYDWANSAYPLVITTAIFPIFYEAVTSTKNANGTIISDMVQFWGMEFKNTELYSYIVALSFIIVSISSPILSGIADYSGLKKRFMQFYCYLGAIACASLYFFSKAYLGWGALSILLASVGFWGSLVFYNAYLPEIADPVDHDKVSAKGYAWGYIGSVLLLIINLILIKVYDMNVRYSFVFVALWWVGFSQITFFNLPNEKKHHTSNKNVFLNGFKELWKVWSELKQIKQLKRYLASFFIYSMGVQTVLLMAVLFAKKEIKGLEDTNLIMSVLMIQFLAIAGSYLFSFSSKKIGNIKTLGIILIIWIAVCIGTYAYVYTPPGFYIVACSVGLIMGGIQSLSRSTYSKLLPVTKDTTSYFSFYDVLEKIGIVIGMFSFGFIERVSGGMRNSILALVIFFIIGFAILLTIPQKEKQ
ncbi:MAG: MFS transporter [Bacteroidia bacterium]